MKFKKKLNFNNTFIIAEIGINHNGNLENALKLIEAAKFAGCNAVKFQKRTPELCVPKDQWFVKRETPWGVMNYIDYKKKIEFNKKDYDQIDNYCKKIDILWTASCWDIQALKFIERYKVKFHKVASACITDIQLLKEIKKTKKPVIISTGMSTEKEIHQAVKIFDEKNLAILHCNSSYPAPTNQLNLLYIKTLKKKYEDAIIGYSGHEMNLASSVAAVVLGAEIIERHITLDKTLWGTDQKASIEPLGLARLIKDIRVVEQSLGFEKKIIYDEELKIKKKLRSIK